MKKQCLICKKWFCKLYNHSENYWKTAKFCSRKCFYLFRKGKSSGMLNKHHSEETKLKMSLAQKGKKFPEQSGKNHPNWKGGRRKHWSGYIYLLMPEHPFAIKSGYYREHRYMCECILNRFLKPEEQLHHINEIKDDNRPENLYLFPNGSWHTTYHLYVKSGKLKPITKSNLKSY